MIESKHSEIIVYGTSFILALAAVWSLWGWQYSAISCFSVLFIVKIIDRIA